MRDLNLCLFGKIIANREINREAFKGLITSIWKTVRDISIVPVGLNLFLFKFQCAGDRKRILEGGPWSFDKQLIVLKEAVGLGRIVDIDFSLVPFWVQLYNIPLICIDKKIGLRLGELLGEVKEIDTDFNGDCSGCFIRLRVMIDINQPLKRGLRFTLRAKGEVSTALLCYERLPNFCYFCGKIGHLIRDCVDNVSNLTDDSQLKFGVWLRAPLPQRNRGRGYQKPKSEFERGEGRNQDSFPFNSKANDENAGRDPEVKSSVSKSQSTEGSVKESVTPPDPTRLDRPRERYRFSKLSKFIL
ncbi:hypothetical protein ACOSQ2_001580 [Xanthoceras sorbifolium]